MVGERWSLLVVREQLLGPKRFIDLQAGLPGAGPNILAQRLRSLELLAVEVCAVHVPGGALRRAVPAAHCLSRAGCRRTACAGASWTGR
jgi:hypothetical protein